MSNDVSVVIPAYNAERWLARALDSVLAQTCPPREIIVIDDGSRDGTPDVARRYGDRVRYVQQANAGVARARNHGIGLATGAWIALLDADDEWLPRKTELQLRILAAHPHLTWCAGLCEFTGALNGEAACSPARVRHVLQGRSVVPFFDIARGLLPLQTSGFIIRRHVLTELGGFDETLRISEDRDLWCRIALRAPDVGYCLEVCYRYYVNVPTSLTKGAAERTAVVQNYCVNLRRARSAGPAAAEAFYAYAREIVLDYLMRAAARQATIHPAAVHEARSLFRPRWHERLLMAALACLPEPWAARAARRLSR